MCTKIVTDNLLVPFILTSVLFFVSLGIKTLLLWFVLGNLNNMFLINLPFCLQPSTVLIYIFFLINHAQEKMLFFFFPLHYKLFKGSSDFIAGYKKYIIYCLSYWCFSAALFNAFPPAV